MKNSFTTGKRGMDLIVEFEGEILKVYNDGFGYPTAGVGHLLSPAEKRAMPIGTKITRQQSRDWLKQDLEEAESAVNSTITVQITQNQFDAMTSLAFNIGTTGFKRSTLARKLNARHFADAADAFLSWNKSRGKVVAGLTRRRKAERALFLTPDSTADPATDGPLIKSNSIQNTATDGSQGQSSIDSTDASGAAPGATSNDKDLSPQLVDKEKPSTFVKWITGIKVGVGALIASLSAYCGGSEVQNLVATKAVENADSSVISLVILIAVITIVLIAIGILLIWIASIFYDRSAARANLLNQQKVEKAASQTENTVEYKK